MIVSLDSFRSRRRRALAQPHSIGSTEVPALFVGCSENYFGSELIEAVCPDQVVKNHGGVLISELGTDAAQRATLQYALEVRGVRHVVLLGHSGCTYPTWRTEQEPAPDRSRTHLGMQARLLRVELDPAVELSALWLDEMEDVLYRLVDVRHIAFQRMGAVDFARFLTSLRAEPSGAAERPR